ncbi:MAG: hypothetical protein HY694_14235 [Deltaproteobacteria bacterium]|nr:hypothetical protein [Deltaproteobacteria bacterium]
MKLIVAAFLLILPGCAISQRPPAFEYRPDGSYVWRGFLGCTEALERGLKPEYRGLSGQNACIVIGFEEVSLEQANQAEYNRRLAIHQALFPDLWAGRGTRRSELNREWDVTTPEGRLNQQLLQMQQQLYDLEYLQRRR